MFDIERFKQASTKDSRFGRRISTLKEGGKHTDSIVSTVNDSISNMVNSDSNSFVIYGEPQSGKTEMMIALAARLLDAGNRMVIMLLNDSVQLLNQNLGRFRKSGLDPSPKSFSEVLDPAVRVTEGEFVIFCKKNSKDLKKLISKIGTIRKKIIVDDEADYATPNAKINKGERTKINRLVGELLGDDGVYIGVTATPARLDLNRTFDNEHERWVDFHPHPNYKGQEFFFPEILTPETLGYRLTLLPDDYDLRQHLRDAVIGFFVNVGHLNLNVNPRETNYSMLIHTSGNRADHTEDYHQVVEILNILKLPEHRKFEQYVKRIWDVANDRYTGHANEITDYILQNINRHVVVVMNSDFDKRNMDYDTATNPTTLFTFAIGGNIVSRGVTFNNLLSMFFTRDVKHKIQQDTYIQRARMFGDRNYDLKYFDLTIPETLYFDWHRCFLFHRLALDSIRSGNGSPVWLEDGRIAAVSGSSIDRARLDMNSGEMSFKKLPYDPSIEEVISTDIPSFQKLAKIASLVGEPALPEFLIKYISRFSPEGEASLAIHESKSIENYTDADKKEIARARGLIGKSDREESKYPSAIHHIKIFFNNEGQARVFYRYHGSISFLRMHKN